MKKYLSISILLFLFCTQNLFSQSWKLLTSPNSKDHHGVFFTSESNGYIAGEDEIIQTKDGGSSWRQGKSLSGSSMQSVFSPSATPDCIYAVGGDNLILKTKDGGANWSTLQGPNLNYIFWWSLFFIDQYEGSVLGYKFSDNTNVIKKTTDGGSSWNEYTVETSGINMRGICFLNRFQGFVTGDGIIRKTADGGVSWSTCYTLSSAGLISDIKRLNNGTILCCSDQGYFIKSSDNGITWLYYSNPNNITSFSIASSGIGWGVNNNGDVYKTVDFGISWTYSANFSRTLGWWRYYQVFTVNDNCAYLVGPQGLIAKYVNIVLPNPPVLSSPSDKVASQSINPTLNWNLSSGATSYRLQVSTNTNFSSTVYDQSGLTNTSQSLSGLSYNTTFYWRVNATNFAGTSGWSTTWSFTSAIPPPSAPNLQSPASNSIGISINPVLSWNASAGASSYHLQISINSSFSPLFVDKDNITITIDTVNNLEKNTIYYWRVNATNNGGTGDWSATWYFKTADVPPSPTLSTPANGTTGITTKPLLIWNTVPNGTFYHIQVSASSSFATLFLDKDSIKTPSYSLSNLDKNIIYYWRIKVGNDIGMSDWSDTWNFKTKNSPPGAFTVSNPVQNAVITLTYPEKLLSFSWNKSIDLDDDTVKYKLSISGTSLGKNYTNLMDTIIALDLMSELRKGTDYSWYVEASDGIDITKSTTNTLKTSDTVTKVNGMKNIEGYSLGQNYPNPFNPSTIIDYQLPKNDHVSLKIYNVLGNEVAVLVDEYKTAGSYSVTIDAKGLPSGIYYYTMRCGNFRDTKKLILMK